MWVMNFCERMKEARWNMSKYARINVGAFVRISVEAFVSTIPFMKLYK